jgi:transcriptional regulator with XRE-family HTH domain
MMTIEQKRLQVLKKLMEGKLHKDFHQMLGISQGYLSHIMTGRNSISEKVALKLEGNLNLVPGTLVNPSDVSAIVSVDYLYRTPGDVYWPAVTRPTPEESIKQIEDRRLAILVAIIGGQPLNPFCANYDLNTSYVSQLINGVKTIGERSAKTLEKKLHLVPDTLIHPEVVDVTDPEAVSALFDPEHQHLSIQAQGLLRQLNLYLRAGLLSDEQISILKLTAGQFAQVSTQSGSDSEALNTVIAEGNQDSELLHFRVTIFHELNQNKTISVMAHDKESAKILAGQRYPDWDVVMARKAKPLVTEK